MSPDDEHAHPHDLNDDKDASHVENGPEQPVSPAGEIAVGMTRGQGGYELTLAPVLLALGGLWIDRGLGVTPLFTVTLATAAFVAVFLTLWFSYRHSMTRLAATRPVRPVAATPVEDRGESPWFEPAIVEYDFDLDAREVMA